MMRLRDLWLYPFALFAVRVVLVPLTRLALFVPASMLGYSPGKKKK